MKRFFTLFTLILSIGMVSAQTPSDFDNIVTQVDTFLNGSEGVDGYGDGDAFFPTTFDTDWFYWSSGWAISSMTDTLTAGFANLYSARPGSGLLGSLGYAVGQQNAQIKMSADAAELPVKGVFITNSTYAYLSMLLGDDFAKKFGGETGDDPDYFLLTIRGYANGEVTADSVNFYLADFRFSDNSQDYIVDSWQYVDLNSLGAVDSLSFELSSSDVGDFGINTPLFFCIDQFNSSDITGTKTPLTRIQIEAFPNPTSSSVTVSTTANAWLQLINAQGQILQTVQTREGTTQLNLTNTPAGIYWIHYFDEQKEGITPIIKK